MQLKSLKLCISLCYPKTLKCPLQLLLTPVHLSADAVAGFADASYRHFCKVSKFVRIRNDLNSESARAIQNMKVSKFRADKVKFQNSCKFDEC